MPAYYYYSAIRGTQTTVDGSAVDYNYAPSVGDDWIWTGSSTSFVLTEANSGGQYFNGDDENNEYVDVNDRIGGNWEQTVEIAGTDRQVIWDYTFTVTDGTTTWQIGVIDVDLNNDNDLEDAGEDGYFLVFPDGFPPANTPLEVGAIIENDDSTPHGSGGLNAQTVCFASGTRIATPAGPRRVEDLRPHDLVTTLDAGPQPLLWAGSSVVPARGHLCPVVFEDGAIGNAGRLVVSPQHCVQVSGPEAQLLTGEAEALARAVHLLGRPGIHRNYTPPTVRYHHLLFDRHHLVLANNVPSESLFPGRRTMRALSAANRAEICRLIGTPEDYGPTARPVLRRTEAACLTAASFPAYNAVPRRPARSVKNCQATRPERPPRVADHSIASARRSASEISMPAASQ